MKNIVDVEIKLVSKESMKTLHGSLRYCIFERDGKRKGGMLKENNSIISVSDVTTYKALDVAELSNNGIIKEKEIIDSGFIGGLDIDDDFETTNILGKYGYTATNTRREYKTSTECIKGYCVVEDFLLLAYGYRSNTKYDVKKCIIGSRYSNVGNNVRERKLYKRDGDYFIEIFDRDMRGISVALNSFKLLNGYKSVMTEHEYREVNVNRTY